MTTQRFDPETIDHTNEELMRHYFTKLAQEAGLARRTAELLFRNTWDKLSRKLSPNRNETFTAMKAHLEESM